MKMEEILQKEISYELLFETQITPPPYPTPNGHKNAADTDNQKQEINIIENYTISTRIFRK